MVRIIYNFRRRLGKVRTEVINHVPILEGSMIPINSFRQMKFPEIPNFIDIVQQMDRWLSQTNQKIFTRFSSSSLIFSFLKISTISFFFHSTRTKVCESKPSSNFLIFEFFMNRQHSEWILNPLIPKSNFFFNLRVCFLCVCGQLLFFLHLSIFEVLKCFFHLRDILLEEKSRHPTDKWSLACAISIQTSELTSSSSSL